MDTTAEGTFFLTGKDFSRAGTASGSLKKVLEHMGLPASIIRRASIAAFEAEMNAIIYAVAGIMRYDVTPEMIKVVLQDMGQGIENIELAMTEGFTTAPDYIREMGFGSGMGLPNIKKNVDKLTITSAAGEGTTLEFIINLDKAGERSNG
jgi:anti-sigma regulatory factor (Ser/Thr protein kinase)